MKLGLGTVQFGMSYGISNSSGRTTPVEASRMLELAASLGVGCLDTAPAYAASEEVLGQSLPPSHAFKIVTKTASGEPIATSLSRSLARMRQPKVHGLLVHSTDALLQHPALFDELRAVKDSGRVEKIGVSVYTSQQIDSVLERFPIDLIQLPLSLLDQRLIASGHLARLKGRGIEIHARSVFLQGLLLLPPDSLPPYFDSVRSHLSKLRLEVAGRGLTMLEAALQFAVQLPEVDCVLVGATNAAELQEIGSAASRVTDGAVSGFAWQDERILNPSMWPARES